MSEAKVAKLTKSSKAFLLTVNEYEKTEEVLCYLRRLNPGYLLAAKEEAPSTGHVHAHIYVQFPNRMKLM